MMVEELDASILVELKGSDVQHAIDQLETSHKALAVHFHANVFWIVSPIKYNIPRPKIDSIKRRMRAKYDIDLIISNSPVEYLFK